MSYIHSRSALLPQKRAREATGKPPRVAVFSTAARTAAQPPPVLAATLDKLAGMVAALGRRGGNAPGAENLV
jgi:hypothetical protein